MLTVLDLYRYFCKMPNELPVTFLVELGAEPVPIGGFELSKDGKSIILHPLNNSNAADDESDNDSL